MLAFNNKMKTKATSAEILNETIKRMRKLSRSADNIDHIQKTNVMVQKTLVQSRSLLGLSADNIYFMSRKSPHTNTAATNQRTASRKPYSSIDDLREHRYCVSPLTLPVHENSIREKISPSGGEIPERKTELERRRLAARKKQTDRQNLLNSLNKDIKQANRFLRNLKTRSMPLLDSLNVNFEIPYDFIQAILAPKRGRLNSMRQGPENLIV
jgi:hypothetical protein